MTTRLFERLHPALWLVAIGWLFACFWGPQLWGLFASWVGVELSAHGHTHVYAHGHPFVDARTWWGIPNAMDVLSNGPLLLAGLGGWWLTHHRPARAAAQAPLRVFFLGLMASGLGSAWYHWAPDPLGLAVDRLGMTVAFAGALVLAAVERGSCSGRSQPVLWVLLCAGAVSALLPWAMGNVLPWAIFQFGGMVFVVAMAWRGLRPDPAPVLGVSLGQLIALYALAKVLELNDEAVFVWSQGLVSGHSLKHVAAALAAWPVAQALLRHNARRWVRP